MLIIDEAQHLPIKTIESIRAFYDSNPDLGIIFVGNAETISNCGKPGKACFAQINNRRKLTEIRHTTQTTREDIRLLLSGLGDRETELLHTVAQSQQGVRGAVNLYVNARDNENVTYEGLLAMAQAMKILI